MEEEDERRCHLGTMSKRAKEGETQGREGGRDKEESRTEKINLRLLIESLQTNQQKRQLNFKLDQKINGLPNHYRYIYMYTCMYMDKWCIVDSLLHESPSGWKKRRGLVEEALSCSFNSPDEDLQ